MMKKTFSTKKSGQVLLAVMLLIILFIGVVILMSRLSLRELKIQRTLDDSMKAYYIAETGIERAVLNFKSGDFSDHSTPQSFGDGSWTYDVVSGTKVISTGIYNGVARKIEVVVEVPPSPTPGDIYWPKNWRELNP